MKHEKCGKIENKQKPQRLCSSLRLMIKLIEYPSILNRVNWVNRVNK